MFCSWCESRHWNITRSCQLPCGRMPGDVDSASCFGLLCCQAEFKDLHGRSISLCEGSAMLFAGLGGGGRQGVKERCVILRSSKAEGYLLAELMEASKPSLGNSSWENTSFVSLCLHFLGY